jgi:adsorption protein B
MDLFLLYILILVSILINISSLDDAFIDLLAFGIKRFSGNAPAASARNMPSSLGVFVANWHEEDVLAKMVEGNLARIRIPWVKLYLGVYPNDTGTLDVAMKLAKENADRVDIVANHLVQDGA